MIRKVAALAIFTIGFIACNSSHKVINPALEIGDFQRPKNIVLMIGDGMGLGQITAGMYANGNKIHLEKFPVIGLQKTYSYNDLITDSAAGATAMACGVKTYNSALGVDKDTLPVKSILEEASEKGWATGLVATSTIVHATPAAFIAHQPLRSMYEYIAKDLLKAEVDLFIGGGKKFFDSQRLDGVSLIPQLEKKGYTIFDDFQMDLNGVIFSPNRKIAHFTANDSPMPKLSGRDYLPLASKLAVSFLRKRSKNGFFLMIEGSQIDWGGHANNPNYIITEVTDFNEAVGKVLNFAQKDKETLVIVTSDHETGGFAINPRSKMDSIVGAFTSTFHTGTMIPVFAYGPGAELFAGIYENTEIYHKMRKALGFDEQSSKSENFE